MLFRSAIGMRALTREKLGYDGPLEFEQWLDVTGLKDIPREGLRQLWEDEQALLEKAGSLSLKAIAERRLQEITTISKLYE